MSFRGIGKERGSARQIFCFHKGARIAFTWDQDGHVGGDYWRQSVFVWFPNWGLFDKFGCDGVRVVESAPDRGEKALLYEWSRAMLDELPPCPEED